MTETTLGLALCTACSERRINMRTKIVNKKSVHERFDSIQEFISVCKSREPRFSDGLTYTRNMERDSWRDNMLFEESVDYVLHGSNKSFDLINSKIKELNLVGETKRPVQKNSVVGYIPNVPNAIIGLPQSMIHSEMKVKPNKVVTLLVETSVSASVSSEKYAEYGAKIVSQVISLEKSGFRVRVDAFDSFNSDSKQYSVRVPIKSEHQPANIKKLAFPLASAAFSRNLCFDWYESHPNSEQMSGYGRPLYAMGTDMPRILDEIKLPNEKCYYLNYNSDLDVIFKNIREGK